MAKQPNSKKIYHPHSPLASFFKVLGLVLLILIIISVFIFFSFQKYIHYKSDGELYLEVPFLSFLDDDEDGEPSSDVNLVVDGVEGTDNSDLTDSDDGNVGLNSDNILRGISVDSLDPADDTLMQQYLSELERRKANAIVAQLKDETGELKFYSSSRVVSQIGIAQGPDIATTVAGLKENGVYMVALISAFEDSTLALKSPSAALTSAGTQQSGGVLDPTSETTISYITDICTEFARVGFDEIVLNNFYISEIYAEGEGTEVLTNAAADLSSALEAYDTKLSIQLEAAAWAGDTEVLADFSQIFHRFFADEADHEIASAAAQTMLGGEYAQRFVLINAQSAPEDCGWVE